MNNFVTTLAEVSGSLTVIAVILTFITPGSSNRITWGIWSLIGTIVTIFLAMLAIIATH